MPDLIALPWVAYIPGWVGLIGDGETKREAYATLLENFTSYKESGESLPRPGTYKPIRFAPTEQIAPYEHMVKNFLAEVAAFEVEWLFVSDVSSLWNFISEDRRDEVFARIQDIYGVDASDIADGNLVRIFKLIEQRVLSV
ncbi:MAG TPA: hypothetical protein VM409_05015 [Chloroflexia bacterium]|nr:hypothetical protein [Chloroflexia bacterium]